MRNGLTMYKVYLPNGERRLIVAKDEADAWVKTDDRYGVLPERVEVSEYNMHEGWNNEDEPSAGR